MVMRWISCGAGHLHIIGPCPECFDTEGGLLVGTVANSYKGRVHTICLDCNLTVDYYTDAKEEKLWKLETVEARGFKASNPDMNKEDKSTESDTQIKAKKSGGFDIQSKFKVPAFP